MSCSICDGMVVENMDIYESDMHPSIHSRLALLDLSDEAPVIDDLSKAFDPRPIIQGSTPSQVPPTAGSLQRKELNGPLWPFMLEKALQQTTKDLLGDMDQKGKSKTDYVSTLKNGVLIYSAIRDDITYPLRKMARNMEEMEREHLPWRHNPLNISSPIVSTSASSATHVEEVSPVSPAERRGTFKDHVST
ncbi:hypothetical protein DDE82_004262 [Stemphylium lycopersici]|nr:hypothetical protein TW65_06535 [Stemphylium lycopersici]RAR04784.1 hypothetical protein DDE82_004262 [Stemphylium lycopersici]